MRIDKKSLKRALYTAGVAASLWTYGGKQWNAADQQLNTPQLQQAHDLHGKADRLERSVLDDAREIAGNVSPKTLAAIISKELHQADAYRAQADALVPRSELAPRVDKYMAGVVTGGFSYLGGIIAAGIAAVSAYSGLAGRHRYEAIFERSKRKPHS